MKIFEKFRKMILSLLIVILLFFSMPIRSEAGASQWAGNTLGQPIMQLTAMLGDIGIGILHKFVLNNDYQIMSSVMLNPDNETVVSGDLKYDIHDVDYDNDGDKDQEDVDKINEKVVIDHTDVEFDGTLLGTSDVSWYGKLGAAVTASAAGGVATPTGGPIAAYTAAKTTYDKLVPAGANIPNIMICPEYIFSNRIALLDVDFVNPTKFENQEGKTITAEIDENGKVIGGLQPVIASWYRAFRNIAIVAMLTILVYIGIRIIIGSTAQDKAKYKERLQDWLVGLCLIFIMHYIMAGTLMVTKGITNMLSDVSPGYVVKLSKNFPEAGDSNSDVFYVRENITGYVRLMAQQKELTDCFAYVIMYIVLVVFTYMFLIKYIKRVLYMAFFTMIAPLVAMTYPLDKLADGKSQGFSMWFKEYLMNALIQPVHLILYTVFVSSATSLAKNNIIYAIVALGFLIPAEKFIKSMFRLDQGKTTGFLGDIAGGALALQGMKSLSNAGKGLAKSSSGGGSSKDKDNNKIRVNKNGNDYFKDIWGNNSNANGGNPPIPGGNPPIPGGNPPLPGGNPPLPGGNPPLPGGNPPLPGGNPPLPGGNPPVPGGNPPTPGGSAGATPALSANATRLNRQNRTYTRRANAKPIRGMVGRAVAAAGNGIYNNRRRIIKGAVGTLAKGAAGFAGATLGLAFATATGDPSKAFAYTAAGVYAGKAVGNKLTNAGEALFDKSVNTAETIRDVYQEEAYGLEQAEQMRKERENTMARNAFMRDPETIKKYKELAGDLGIENYRTVMDYAWDYREAGITDDDKITHALKTETKHPEVSHEAMLGVMQATKNMSEDTILDDRKRTALENSLTAQLGGDSARAEEIMQLASETVGQGDYYKKIKQDEKNAAEVARANQLREEAENKRKEEKEKGRYRANGKGHATPFSLDPQQPQQQQPQPQPQPQRKQAPKTPRRTRGKIDLTGLGSNNNNNGETNNKPKN